MVRKMNPLYVISHYWSVVHISNYVVSIVTPHSCHVNAVYDNPNCIYCTHYVKRFIMEVPTVARNEGSHILVVHISLQFTDSINMTVEGLNAYFDKYTSTSIFIDSSDEELYQNTRDTSHDHHNLSIG